MKKLYLNSFFLKPYTKCYDVIECEECLHNKKCKLYIDELEKCGNCTYENNKKCSECIFTVYAKFEKNLEEMYKPFTFSILIAIIFPLYMSLLKLNNVEGTGLIFFIVTIIFILLSALTLHYTKRSQIKNVGKK